MKTIKELIKEEELNFELSAIGFLLIIFALIPLAIEDYIMALVTFCVGTVISIGFIILTNHHNMEIRKKMKIK